MSVYYTISTYADGSNILNIYCGKDDFEAGWEIFPFDGGSLRIALVRIIIAGGVSVMLTVPQLASAIEAAEVSGSLPAAVFGGQRNENPLSRMDKLGGAVNIAVPDYFALGHGGVSSSGMSRGFASAVCQRGGALLPRITHDEGDFGSVLENAHEIAHRLVGFARRYDFHGFTLDLPGANGAQARKFAEILSEKLPNSRVIAMIVYPERHGYNYEALNKTVDLFMVNSMSYLGQNAPKAYYSTKNAGYSAQKLVKAGVNPEKIVLGVSFGACLWGQGYEGMLLDWRQTEKLMQDVTIKERYNEQDGETWWDFSVRQGQKVYIGGNQIYEGSYKLNLGGGTYARDMLSLARKMGLRGGFTMAAPLSSQDIWDYYSLWLGQGYFEDVTRGYARDDVMENAAKGLLKGVSRGRFVTYEKVTRGQAAAILTRALSLQKVPSHTGFSDIAGHWAENYIAAAEGAGLLCGYTDGTFRPDNPLTPVETATMIAHLCGLKHNKEMVAGTQGNWTQGEIGALLHTGILQGYDDGNFRLETTLSRGEIASLLSRIDKLI